MPSKHNCASLYFLHQNLFFPSRVSPDRKVLSTDSPIASTSRPAGSRKGKQKQDDTTNDSQEGGFCTLEQAARKSQIEAQKAEEAARSVQRIILGSFVTFGAGLLIRDAITGFECSRLRVRNLPSDATREEVHALFTQQGIDSDRFYITEMERAADGRQEANVLSEAEIAQVISVGLELTSGKRSCNLRCSKMPTPRAWELPSGWIRNF